MKTLILIFTTLISAVCFGQNPKQGMKILLTEKTKGDTQIRIKNTEISISLNDSINYNTITDNEGYVDIETQTGKFSVRVRRDSCQTVVLHDVVVGIAKKAYITFELTCPNYINSLTKKELKKLGIRRVDAKKN